MRKYDGVSTVNVVFSLTVHLNQILKRARRGERGEGRGERGEGREED